MLQADSLTDKRIFANKVDLVVSDLDYTLSDFNHKAGIETIAKILGKDAAEKVDYIFKLIHEQHVLIDDSDWKKKAEFKKLIKNIGLRKYSREAFIIIACRILKIRVNREIVEKGRDGYWQGVRENSKVYPDAKIFLDQLRKNHIPLIIMTGSDSLMKVHNDLTLEYDPIFSFSYKKRRVERLLIDYKSLIIGDPYDKPDRRFFDLVDKEITRIGRFKKENILFIGDSYKADLEVPEKRGYKTALIKR